MIPHVSMKDVAAKAGVDRSTVSLCLNNSPLVAEKTRERVLKIAAELGYRPHPYLTALMRNRRKGRLPGAPPTLAFMTFFPTRNGWYERFPSLKETFEWARRQAEFRGFRLEEFWAPLVKYSPERIGNILYTRNISGILFSSFPHSIERFDWQWERFAVVAIGPSLRDPRVHRLRCNHFKSTTIAINNCRRLGYKRIGLALKREVSLRMDHRWLAAYLIDQQEGEPATCLPPLLAPEWNKETFIRWIRSARPDVVIVTSSSEPISWLEAEGLSVPNDVGVVSLSCPKLGGAVSGVYENWELQGSRAVNLLIDLLADNELGLHEFPSISLVDGAWNPGETVRVPAKNEE